MKKILFLLSLILFISCGGKGVEGNVGQIISISAEENLEEPNVDYNWIIVGQPDGSLLSPKDLKYKNNGQEMIFIPDYPGDFNFEVSVTKFGDELSSQSFFFTISDLDNDEQEKDIDETEKEEQWLKEDLEEENENEENDENDENDEEEENDENENENEKKYSRKNIAKTRGAIATKSKTIKGSDIPAKKDRFTIQVISKKQLLDAKNFADKLLNLDMMHIYKKLILKKLKKSGTGLESVVMIIIILHKQ